MIFPDDELTVMRVDKSITRKLKVPCERGVLRAFKAAAALQEAGSRPEQEIECVREAFRASRLAQGTPSSSAGSVFESFSKREVVQMLQKQASVEWLRQYRLNGSEVCTIRVIKLLMARSINKYRAPTDSMGRHLTGPHTEKDEPKRAPESLRSLGATPAVGQWAWYDPRRWAVAADFPRGYLEGDARFPCGTGRGAPAA